MKLTKTAAGGKSLKITRAEWEAIGRQAKWTPPWLDKKEDKADGEKSKCKCSDGGACKCDKGCTKCSCKK